MLPTMFPLPAEEMATLGLEHAMRVLPHMQAGRDVECVSIEVSKDHTLYASCGAQFCAVFQSLLTHLLAYSLTHLPTYTRISYTQVER